MIEQVGQVAELGFKFGYEFSVVLLNVAGFFPDKLYNIHV